MNGKSYQVIPYDETTLHIHLKGFNDSQLCDKKHIIYLKSYLKHKKVKTIIIEYNYVDRYYLEDYSEYYVRCFEEYKRFCKRLHFFKDKENIGFTEADFSELLSGNDRASINTTRLNDNYVGFMVLKPLPETLIGRTCLEAYEEEGTDFKRYYPVAKTSEVGLFGIRLTVSNTLPFQEQDKVISACATSALWTLFHGVSTLKSFQIKSPAHITKMATANIAFKASTYPVMGLTPEMMGHALISEGLEAHHISLLHPYRVNPRDAILKMKENIYAYLKNKIPALLGLDIYHIKSGDKKIRHAEHIGKHAVTVTGFSLPNSFNYNFVKGGFITKASFIDKLYVHDDQIGPFCKISFGDEHTHYTVSNNSKDIAFEGTSDNHINLGLDSAKHSDIGIPNNLVLGLYHKIRLPYIMIREGVSCFNALFNDIISKNKEISDIIYSKSAKAFTWDIHLITPTDLKSELLQSKLLQGDYLEKILIKNMPRFIWRAKAEYETMPLFDMLFDATDIPQGRIFMRTIEYNDKISAIFDYIFGALNKYLPTSIEIDDKHLLGKIIKGLGERNPIVEDSLTKLYGALRPPIHIKEYEKNANNTMKEVPGLIDLKSPAEFELDKEVKYLWSVSGAGSLLVAPEKGDPPLGHPNLTGGNPARICGELFFDHDEDTWILNNASGRYSLYAPGIDEQTLENVKSDLFEKYLPHYAGKFHCKLSDRHGSHIVNTIHDVVELCNIAAKNGINHESLQLIASQAISRRLDIVPSILGIAKTEEDNELKASYYWLLMHYINEATISVEEVFINDILEEYSKFETDQLVSSSIIGLLLEAVDKCDIVPANASDVLIRYFLEYKNNPETDVLNRLALFYRKNILAVR